MSNTQTHKRSLTGRDVLVFLFAFFGITIAANAYFMTMAVKSFRGEDVKGSYRQGLEYNQTLQARDAQKQLGWTARANVVQQDSGLKTIVIQFSEQTGSRLTGLSVSGKLRHHIDTVHDRDLSFVDAGAGRWTAELLGVDGEYTLKAVASKGRDSFVFHHSVSIP